MKSKTLNYILALICLLLAFKAFKRNEYTYSEQNIILKSRLDSVVTILEDKDKQIFSSESVTFEDERQIKRLTDTITVIKKIREVVMVQQDVRVDTIFIKIDKSDVQNKTFVFSDEWIDINGGVDDDNIKINKISLKNEVFITLGEEKRFLKSNLLKVNVRNTNPYFFQGDLKSLTKKIKPPRYSFGISVGYGVTENGLSPYLGVGIQRNLISF